MQPTSAHRVVSVAYPGLALFEFGIATELFGLPRPELSCWYQYEACSYTPGSVQGTAGLRVTPHGGLKLLERAHTVLIPGWCGVDVAPPEHLLSALRRAHQRGARVVSFCSGAFVLAAAGLLDGRRAATHWAYAAALSERYPEVEVDPNVLYVEADNVFTSAGSAAAIDLCLHLIRRDHGAEVAARVARRLVVPPYREGGQAQFVEPAHLRSVELDPMHELMTWVQRRLAQPHTVASLARQAKVSPRSLARHFLSATGTTPLRWLVRQRVFAAQRMLEASDASIEEITSKCGLGTSANLRRHFTRAIGVSPASYRATFRGAR